MNNVPPENGAVLGRRKNKAISQLSPALTGKRLLTSSAPHLQAQAIHLKRLWVFFFSFLFQGKL